MPQPTTNSTASTTIFSPINKIAISLLTITLVASAIIATLGLLGVLPTIAGWAGLGTMTANLLILLMYVISPCPPVNTPPPSVASLSSHAISSMKTTSNTSSLDKHASSISLKNLTPNNFLEYLKLCGGEKIPVANEFYLRQHSHVNQNTFMLCVYLTSTSSIDFFEPTWFELDNSEGVRFKRGKLTFSNLEELINNIIDELNSCKELICDFTSIEKFTIYLKSNDKIEIRNPYYKVSGST